MTFAESLGSIDIFRNLPPGDLAGLAELCTWSRYEPHQEIVGYLDESRQVFFLAEGTARAIIYSLSGKEVTFRDIDAGEMFGEFAAIDGEPRSASVEALAPCLVATLSAERFWEVLRDHPKVTEATLQRLTRQIRALTERVLEFSTLAVKHRIHAELLRMARDHLGGRRHRQHIAGADPSRVRQPDQHSPGGGDPGAQPPDPHRPDRAARSSLDHPRCLGPDPNGGIRRRPLGISL